jgi:hypothetical protein
MPADVKPLFRPDALRPHLERFTLPAAALAARPKLAGWAQKLAAGQFDKLKETELLPGFVTDVFEGLLGYLRPPADPYTLKREALVKVDGKFADAGLGRFTDTTAEFVAVLEGKGPLDPLDRPFAGRKRSAVEQALQYAVQLRIDWYLVTNLKETRLYHKGHDTFTYEKFETAKLAADDAELRRFVFLVGAERVVPPAGPCHLDALLAESKAVGRKLTNDFYAEYRALRERTFDALREHNPGRPPAALLAATQKVLDRVLFVAFCEDRGLLPGGIIARAYQNADPFNPRPVWQNFVGLFRAVDAGSPHLNVERYNGGLFAEDEFLDTLAVPDAVCEGFKTLAEYEYGTSDSADAKLIDVEILGHIFEQSITDLEELHAAVSGDPTAEPARAGPSKRKKEGAFYTPDFVTRFIVAETLGPVLRDRFEALRAEHEATAARSARKMMADPRVFDPKALNEPQRIALAKFWGAWLDVLETIRIVDPSCGSGAFLIEAFDQMFAQYEQAEDYLVSIGHGSGLYEPKKTILTRNLFGMDLNSEAVEIARLSCWIKTAEKGKELTTLDDNIVRGNSVVADPSPLEGWRARFPAAFADGGFDVVIGNPPYVRQEWIKADKPYLQRHYRSFDGVADLYVYFYELGLNVLKPGGRLGFIVTNKWMKAGYGEPLRALYGDAAWVEQVIDFGHAKQIFPDADVFPCILVARKPDAGPAPEAARACVIPRELLRVEDLSRQVAETGTDVPRTRFGPEPWNLEPPAVEALMAKIRANGVPLKEFAGANLLSGIKTGFNDAYLIDTAAKTRLVMADPKSEPLFKPYLRGQDIDRWQAEWSGLWMIAMKSSGNHAWPWMGKPDAEAEAVFRQTYPALFGHFDQYRNALTNRQDQGEYWWELRACAYWEAFDKPKVMYQQIQFHPSYLFDADMRLANNKVSFITSSDLYLLGVLNSPLMWWHNWRYLPHMKDEALAPVGYMVQEIPIPRPTDDARRRAEALVRRLVELKGGTAAGVRAFLEWLQSEFGIEKVSQKLAALVGLSPDELIAEVKKLLPRKRGLTVAEHQRLKAEHAGHVAPFQSSAREAAALERDLSDLVNAAFGLTPADVQLLWDTAPPRMPTARPLTP